MGKKLNNTNNKQKSIINGKYYPLVSVCTPTFNRRPFISTMLECFRNQTYPKHRIEWIIVDDGSDKIKDLLLVKASERIDDVRPGVANSLFGGEE